MQSKKIKRLSRMDILIIAAIFLVITFLIYRGSIPGVLFKADKASMTLTGPQNTSITLSYSDILSASFIAEPDYGSSAGGGTDGSYHYGIWQNEEWGTYQSFVSVKIPCCIVLNTADDTIVFNFESQDTTEKLYPSLLEFGHIEDSDNL